MSNPAARPQFPDDIYTTLRGFDDRIQSLERVVNSGGLTGVGSFQVYLGADISAGNTIGATFVCDKVAHDLSGFYDASKGVFTPTISGHWLMYLTIFVDNIPDPATLVVATIFNTESGQKFDPESGLPPKLQSRSQSYAGGDKLSISSFGIFQSDGTDDSYIPAYALSNPATVVSGQQNTFFGGFLVAQSGH